MTVNLIDIIGSSSAVSPRKGLVAYDFVAPKIFSGESIDVSFEGITDLTSAFCNAFIGKLYMTLDTDVVKTKLRLSGIAAEHVWMRKIENAILLGSNENARNFHHENLEKAIHS
jgi:hypothetical protein